MNWVDSEEEEEMEAEQEEEKIPKEEPAEIVDNDQNAEKPD